jgi:pyruvate dehydrogenase E2 component (dihydrolipoamide acetyltransferase)
MDVLMPQLGETVAEGKVVKWFKKVGDKVAPGENLCEIETDKVTVEVPAISGGVLATINVGEGTVAPVGTVLAMVADGSAAPGPAAAVTGGTGVRAHALAPPPHATNGSPQPATPLRDLDVFREVQTPIRNFGPARANGILVTPLARRLAAEAELDLAAITGTGPYGRITGKDIETAIRAKPATTPSLARAESFDEMIGDIHRARPHAVVPVSTMRRTIAKRLIESKSSIPHFYLSAHACTDRLMALRDEVNAGAPRLADGTPAYKISVNDLMIKALGMALKAVPRANAIWSQDGILEFEHADVSVAVAVPNGLITPVIHATEGKPLSVISNEMRGLAARAKEGSLQPSEYKGGTTTLSNLGMYGVVAFSAIINPPQATILAVGAAERVAVERGDGTVAFAGRITATLSCDHRVVDGVLGAELLAAFKANVENPLAMLV